MPKHSTKQKDENQIAASIINQITEPVIEQPAKNPAAVALGRLGGLKGGKARAKKLTKEELSKIGKKGAKKRWGKRKKTI